MTTPGLKQMQAELEGLISRIASLNPSEITAAEWQELKTEIRGIEAEVEALKRERGAEEA